MMNQSFNSHTGAKRLPQGWAVSALVLLLATSGAGRAQAQCITCASAITTANAGTDMVLVGGETITIAAGVSYGGKMTVQGNNVTITNNGTIGSQGTLIVKSGVAGTVINNLGTVTSQNIKLSAPTTINNGSRDGGTTVVASAAWTGYVGENFTTAVTINNYGTWGAQIQALPGGTISNRRNASWTPDLTNAGSLTVTNAGRWSGHLQTSGNAAAFTISNTATGNWAEEPYLISAQPITINNQGVWTAQINYRGALTVNHTSGNWTAILASGAGSSSLTVNNSAAWNKGIIFPGPGPNAFTNAAGATATFDTYLGISSPITITNSGSMSMAGGMGDLGSSSVLTNNRGAIIRITGQFVNFGRVTNSGILAATGNFTNSGSGVVAGPAAPLRGSITAAGYSRNQGIFGVTGQLDFCDTGSDAGTPSGFDSQTGTVGSATTFCSQRPLPVELASFSAEAAKGQVKLLWTTASERNSAKFVVERSATGEAFGAVREVAAQGNSSSVVVYAASDAQPLAGVSYYRLRQVDLDGSMSFSQVVSVRSTAGYQAISSFPNPATDHLTLDLTAAPAEPCEVRLLSLTGQVVRQEVLAGGQLQSLSLLGYPVGVYLLQVRTSLGSSTQRIQKL